MDTKWVKLSDIPKQPYAEAVQLFREHINPGLVALLEIGEYTSFTPESAQGAYLQGADGRRILDVVSSYGALNFGHNHPVIGRAVQQVMQEERVDLCKEILSPYAAFLAHNLSLLTPKGLDRFFFCNSGTEAVEAALKLAARCFKGKRTRFIYAHNSLHGKTIGALSVTGGEKYREFFPLLPGYEVPFADPQAIEDLLKVDARRKQPQIAAVILEPIQGEAGVMVPPPGYLQQVREMTRNYGVLFIVDEIQTGMGRSGDFLACGREGVVPDIIAMAKSLGGGICSIGTTIYSRKVMRKAYPNPHDCLVQTSTFGGRTTACAAAIAALEVLDQEDLIANSNKRGEQLLAGLQRIRGKYPEWVKDIRGRGLMVGIEFNVDVIDQTGYLPLKVPGLKSVLREHLPGMVAAALLKQHDILGTLMLNNRAVLRVYPPLIITAEQIDYFLESLEDILSQGPRKLVKNRVDHAVKNSGLKFIGSWAVSFMKK